MGISLSIGQAFASWASDVVRVEAELSEAGATHYARNQRRYLYSQWSDICEDLGINELMRGTKDDRFELEWGGCIMPVLMPDHPGCAPIREDHLEYLRSKIDQYKEANPGGGRPESLDAAEWMLFWIEWALKNCSKPVFVNS
jgi:hypothetical protein